MAKRISPLGANSRSRPLQESDSRAACAPVAQANRRARTDKLFKRTNANEGPDTPDHLREGRYRLIRKSALVSFVPLISSRIQRGSTPRPDQTRLGSLLLR